MNTSVQRYIFTDFEHIQRINYQMLERTCDKVFILINASDELIPFDLVKNLQKMGKAVKWIAVENNKNLTLNYHICYLIGKMHSKISKDIEFAILSDDDAFDSMINYVKKNNRKCRRVKTGAPAPKIIRKVIVGNQSLEGERAMEDKPSEMVRLDEPKDSLVAYRDTKDRLRMVSTRPYNVASLREYIHINNQELVERGKLTAEDIIDLMESNNEIEIKDGLVAYHF